MKTVHLIKKTCALLLISSIGCMTADPNRTEYTVNKQAIQWNMVNYATSENDAYAIALTINQENNNIFNSLLNKYYVDGSESARDFLTSHFDFCLLTVKNRSDQYLNFKLSALDISINGKAFKAISPDKLPTEISRINPKGMTKNFYNIVVIIAITAAVMFLIVAAAKGGGGGALPDFPSGGGRSPNNSSQEPPTKKEFWSSISHGTAFTYEDMILDENSIAPGAEKSGIVFVRKGLLERKGKLTLIYQE